MKLTDPQKWALRAIAQGKGGSPAQLGEAMMDRPGASDHRGRTPYKAQGYGRMGGAMMARLKRMGLVELTSVTRGHWHPTKARISALGRMVLSENE